MMIGDLVIADLGLRLAIEDCCANHQSTISIDPPPSRNPQSAIANPQ
jgi:hypothetical protein